VDRHLPACKDLNLRTRGQNNLPQYRVLNQRIPEHEAGVPTSLSRRSVTLNLSMPGGFFVYHHHLKHQKIQCSAHSVSFIWISKQTATSAIYGPKTSVFITEMDSNAEGFWVFQRWMVLLLTTFRGPLSASSSSRWKMRLTKGLETSSVTVPFTAEKPRNLWHYKDHGESLKSRNGQCLLRGTTEV
jgi:hypothetical protein